MQRREGDVQGRPPERQLAAGAQRALHAQRAAQRRHLWHVAGVQLEQGVGEEAGDVAGQVGVLLRRVGKGEG